MSNNKLISDYGKVFRTSYDKKIIDLDEKLNIDFDYQIHRIEHLVTEFKEFMPPNRMSHYFMALVKTGKGEKTIGAYNFNIQPNTIMVVPLRGIHSSRNWDINNKGYMLSFSNELLMSKLFFRNFLNTISIFKSSCIPYRYITIEESNMISAIYEDIINEQSNYLKSKKEMICLKIAELIISYNRIFSKSETYSEVPFNNDLYDRFIDLLEINFTKEKSVKYYSSILSIHPNHLNSVVKNLSGISAKDHIQKRLHLEAKYLLASTLLSIKEISAELGFEDQNNFSSFFKKVEKITPLEYRNKPV